MADSLVRRDGVVDRFRAAFAFVLFAHGVAHLVGTQSAAEAARSDDVLEYLFGAWEIGASEVLYAVAALWGCLAAGFALVSWVALMGSKSWRGWATWLAFASLIVSVVAMPQAWIGVLVNMAIIGLVYEPRPNVPGHQADVALTAH